MDSSHALDVPIVSEENICLPLVVSAVSKYWGVDLPLAEATEIATKYPGVKGSILAEGVGLAERHGLGSVILNSSMRDLKRFIEMGLPPIVILPGIKDVVQHASLVIGYDEVEKTIFHYIPEPDKIGAIPEETFDRQWEEDDRLVLLIAPPDILAEAKIAGDNGTKSNRLCFDAEKQRLQGRGEEAAASLKRALELNPSNSTASCLYAGMLNDANKTEAAEYYRRSIELNRRCYLAYRGLGNYCLKSGDYAGAEKYYSEAIGINPHRFAPIYKNRGVARLEQKKTDGAREDLERYLEEMPDARDRAAISQALSELH
ncbi:MAG: tetratricopeptide repeat protein [Thaumarchaeota archaeon]|nr:tetratricopeptide repeat protein [Nitrososphaerota archaeon]